MQAECAKKTLKSRLPLLFLETKITIDISSQSIRRKSFTLTLEFLKQKKNETGSAQISLCRSKHYIKPYHVQTSKYTFHHYLSQDTNLV